jgi:transposase
MLATYCPDFKMNCVELALSNQDGKSIDQLANEQGVSRATLFRWIKAYGPQAASLEKRKARPQEWSLASKLKTILETQGMSENELGAYLRTKGLYFSHLLQWKQEVLEEVKQRGKSVPTGEAALLKRIRELERELKRKDKALREATALAILKKKAELLWPENVEENSPETPETTPLSSSKKPKKTAQD